MIEKKFMPKAFGFMYLLARGEFSNHVIELLLTLNLINLALIV